MARLWREFAAHTLLNVLMLRQQLRNAFAATSDQTASAEIIQ